MVEGSSPRDLLQRFQSAQARRAQLYSRFDAGFKRYLETRQEGIYRRLLAELTAEFSECSAEVLGIEAALREGRGRGDLAALLRGVQQGEREKLRATLALQALRGAYDRQEFSWQREEQQQQAQAQKLPGAVSASGQAASGMSMLQLGESGGSSTQHQHQQQGEGLGGHAACCGHGHSQPPEPTELEYNCAVAEAIQVLQRVVTDINERLEEVKYALEELD